MHVYCKFDGGQLRARFCQSFYQNEMSEECTAAAIGSRINSKSEPRMDGVTITVAVVVCSLSETCWNAI
jgi:hypothetical protein